MTVVVRPGPASAPPVASVSDAAAGPSRGDVAEMPPARPSARAGAARGVARHLAVIAAFGLPAVVLWWHAWDGHLGTTLTCACGDAGQEVWFMAWPAYALAHGMNPFFSPALQAPHGVNLLSNAAATPVGIVLAPVTWVAGPVVSTNVALTLCPALSSWGCWVAGRRLVSWGPPAVVAGALFGYSPFVVSNLATGHVSLALEVAPPLLLVAGRELLYGRPDHRLRWGAAAGALVAVQFLVSSEILAITVLVGVPAAVVAFTVGPRSGRCPPADLLRGLGTAVAVAGVLLAFPVWLALFGPQHIVGPPWPDTILSGNPLPALWDPGAYAAAASPFVKLGGYEGAMGPPSSYLGVAVLGLAVACLGLAWRRRTTWLLAASFVVCVVLSWGALLVVAPGRVSAVWLPWRVIGTWPLLDDVIPQRFSAIGDLLVALLIAVGLDQAGRRWASRRSPHPGTASTPGRPRRLVVAGVVVAVSVVPLWSMWRTYQVPLRATTVSVPRWFETKAPRLAPGTIVLTYPFPFPSAGTSAPMVWQAVDDMRFGLAGGYVKTPGRGGTPLSDHPSLPPYGILAALSTRAGGPLPRATATEIRQVRAALAGWDVDVVVVTDRGRDPGLAVRIFTAAVGTPPHRQDGAWVWSTRPAGRADLQPSGTSPAEDQMRSSG